MKINFWLLRITLIVIGAFAGEMCVALDEGKSDVASSSSIVDVDPAFVFATRLPYFNNQSPNFQTNPNFLTIARFKLTDGDGLIADADATATSIQSITFSITNPQHIRRIALYDKFNNVVPGTEQDLNAASSVVFSALQTYLFAADDNSATFTIQVSFNSTVVDRDVIRLNITAVTADLAGSLFNTVPATLIGGVAGGAITPSNRNLIDVVANQLVFATQPGAVEGINQPAVQPVVNAIDQNGLLDFDASGPTITSAVGLLNVPAAFSGGVLNFSGFQYTSVGNGTLTASIGFPVGIQPVASTRVDVIHMTASLPVAGVIPSSALSSGSSGNVIFGITFNVPYSITTAPKLNEFTIDFGNPFAGVLDNFRVYASLDGTLNKVVDQDITSLIATTVAGNSLKIIFNTGNNLDDFLHPKPGFPIAYDAVTNSTHISYFIEADVDPNANFSVLPVTPSVSRLSYSGPTAGNIILTQGSSVVNITGSTYTFNDITKPKLASTAPFIGQLNQAVNGDIVLTFSEPVKAITGKITVFETELNKFVAELTTTDPLNTLRTSFTFKTTYVDPVTTLLTNYLKPDTRYYMTVPTVDANATEGFIDASDNGYNGITNYSQHFKTSSLLPPVVTNAAQFNNISLQGGTLSIGLDQGGDVFYMIVSSPSANPGSIAEIEGSSTYNGGTVITRGTLKIEQPNTYQYAITSAALGNNAKYDIYMYARNDAAIPVTTGILPPLSFIAKDPVGAGVILESPTVNICPGGFIKVFSPISIVERNIDDFQNKDGDLSIALPAGFIFNTDVEPVLTLIGPDFSDPDTVEFVNNTLLRVTFKNKTANGFDRLTISGLQIKATAANGTGKIIKLAGSALPSINSTRALTTLTVKARNAVDFSNNDNSRFFSDDAKNVLLTANPSDFGPNVFSGPGIVAGSDSLYLRLAGIGAHGISLTHTYEDGCVVKQTDIYTIFPHNNAIAGLDKSQYCTSDGLAMIPFDGRAASTNAPFYLKSLSVDLPQIVLDDTVQLLGKYYRDLVKSSLRKTDSIVVGGIKYRSYAFDPSVFNTPQLRALFKTTDGGGLLGQIEFTSVYVSGLTFKESALPLRLSINVPPAPIITEDVTGLNSAYPSQYCEDLGKIRFSALPVPVPGQRSSSFQLNRYNASTKSYQPVPGLGVLTDLKDGNAIFDTKASVAVYGYDSLRIDYFVHSLSSQCDAVITKKFRITPNPVANFVLPGAACEKSMVKFRNTSTIAGSPNDFKIDTWSWNFDDPNFFTPENPNKIDGNTQGIVNPVHQYTVATAGGYNPVLIVKSNFGCQSVAKSVNVIVGGVPVISLTYSGVSAPITLTSTATVFDPSGIDSVKYYYRKHRFSKPVQTKDTTYTFLPPAKPFSPSPGIYDVKLRVKSKLGCEMSVTKKVVVLELKNVTASRPYIENFEKLDSGGWQIQPDTTHASWRVGKPGPEKTVIKNNPSVNGNAFWYTGRKGSYHSREISYLYSNVYDISTLNRPLITFNSIVQMEQSDGIVLQYSLDNKNVADSTKVWTTLGSFEGVSSGEGWYNAQGLAAKPGKQTVKDYGWTGSSEKQWGSSAHALDEIMGVQRVVFRFALGSVKDIPLLDGFGFDNIRIGNRTRTVLLESFTNTGNKVLSNGTLAEKRESDAIFNFNVAGAGIEIVKLNYHVDYPEIDPLNKDAPAPPSSRALFYGVNVTPRSVLDGSGSPDPALPYFSQWGSRQFNLRTLKLSQADIQVTPLAGNSTFTENGIIGLNVRVTAVEALPAQSVLQIAIVEQQIKLPSDKQSLVKTGETEFNYVVKALLPSASGIKFSSNLPAQSSIDLGPIKWTPDLKKFYNNPGNGDLSIVVFLQNEQTREVYQSVMISNLNDPANVVTGLEGNLLEAVSLYPNPADREFIVVLPQAASKEIPLTLTSVIGSTVGSAIIQEGQKQKTISTELLVPGLYILQLGEGESSVRRRIMVVH